MKMELLFANNIAIWLLIGSPFSKEISYDTSNVFGNEWVTYTVSNCPTDSIQRIYENGVFRRQYTYYACKDSGEFLFFSDTGDTLTHSFFINRKTVGNFKTWYPNGHQQSITRFNDSGQKHGLSETWREDGTRKDSTVYEKGQIIEIREYFLTGQLRYWSNYVNNLLITGDFIHPDGRSAGKVRNGNGEVITYLENGKKRFRDIYKDGKEISSKEIPLGDQE